MLLKIYFLIKVKAAVPRKSTIGAKKPAKKPGGLGGKKGLGATKVTKDFSEIERDAEMADNIAVARREEAKVEAAKTEEEAAAQMASMRLAYQDLTSNAEKQKKELSKMDPKKAEQMERLGMGFGGGGAGLGAGIQSHSLSSSVIVQVRGINGCKSCRKIKVIFCRKSPITQENTNLVAPLRTNSLTTLRWSTRRRCALLDSIRNQDL